MDALFPHFKRDDPLQPQDLEPRHVPLHRPEEVKRWLRLAYLEGLRAGQNLKEGETA